jgi:hypothetical protein
MSATKPSKSLQKIESEVERLSSDTTGLIKAGWDRMLGNVAATPDKSAGVDAREMTSGLLAELLANAERHIGPQDSGSILAHEEKLDDLFKYLGKSLEAQILTRNSSERPSEALDRVLGILNSLSPEASPDNS